MSGDNVLAGILLIVGISLGGLGLLVAPAILRADSERSQFEFLRPLVLPALCVADVGAFAVAILDGRWLEAAIAGSVLVAMGWRLIKRKPKRQFLDRPRTGTPA